MAMVSSILMGAGLAIAAGTTAYGIASAPGSPSVQSPPPAPNSVAYGDDGGIISSQTYDAATNTWVTRSGNSAPVKPKDIGNAPNMADYSTEPMFDGETGIQSAGAGTDNSEYQRALSDYESKKAQYDKDMAQYNTDYAAWETKKKARDEAAALDKQRSDQQWADYAKNQQRSDQEYLYVQEQRKKNDEMLAQFQAEQEKTKAELETQYNALAAQVAQGKQLSDADRAKLVALRDQMQANINQTPADRQAAYEEYKKKYSASMHSEIDPQFQQMNANAEEGAISRGLFGSRAYVDSKDLLAKDEIKSNTNIADRATMASEELANSDRQYWANLLGQANAGIQNIDSLQSQIAANLAAGKRADVSTMAGIQSNINQYGLSGQQLGTQSIQGILSGMNEQTALQNQIQNNAAANARANALNSAQISNIYSGIGSQGYQNQLAGTNMANNNAMALYGVNSGRAASYANTGTNMAGGLMYLYGQKNKTANEG